MNNYLKTLSKAALSIAFVFLAGCATVKSPTGIEMSKEQYAFILGGKDYFPGGKTLHSFGSYYADEKQFRADIKNAEVRYLFLDKNGWECHTVPNVRNIHAIQYYSFLSVRWLNNDGEYYYLNNINIRELMKEYFKKNKILLQHEIEKRTEDYLDGIESFVYTIMRNKIIIGWYVRRNVSPIVQGQVRRYVINEKYYPVAELEGMPAEGVNKINSQQCLVK